MRQPIPTEYKGVRFRSKSEAVFARCLDLAGWQWIYEPGSIESHPETEIHQWDFLINKRRYSDYAPNEFLLVEYKPSMPTEAYMGNLFSKVSTLVSGDIGRKCIEFCKRWGVQPIPVILPSGEKTVAFDRRAEFNKYIDAAMEIYTDHLGPITRVAWDEAPLFGFMLAWGSPWRLDYLISNHGNSFLSVEFGPNRPKREVDPGPSPLGLGITEQIAHEAKRYRFDLRGGGN